MTNPMRHRWAIMGLWLLSSVAGFMMVISVGLLLPSISADLGLTPTQQGFYGSAAFLGNLFLTLPISWWVSRYRPKILTTVTFTLSSALMFVQSWGPNFGILLLGRLGFGISTLAREPARVLLMHRLFTPREFILVSSVYNLLFGLVVGGGLVLTPIILSRVEDDWRSVLLTFAVTLGVLAVLWTVLGSDGEADPESEQRESEDSDEDGRLGIIKRVLGYKELWIAGAGSMGTTMAWSSFVNFYPTLMLDVYDVSLNWTGLLLAIGIATGGPSGVALSRIVPLVSGSRRRNILQAIGVTMVVTYLAMTLTDSIPLLIVITLVSGVAQGYWPVLNSIPFYLPGIRPRESAVALSFMMTLGTFGVATGPALVGALQDRLGDLRLAMMIISFAPAMLVICSSLVNIRTDREEESAEVGTDEHQP